MARLHPKPQKQHRPRWAVRFVPALSACLFLIGELPPSSSLTPRALAQPPAPKAANPTQAKQAGRSLVAATRKQANLALKQGDAAKALELYEALLLQHPDLADDSRALVFEEMGEVHLQGKQLDAALEVYERGLAALSPEAGVRDVSPYALLRLINGKAQTLRAKRQFKEALSTWEEAWPLIVAAGRSAPGGWEGSRYEAALTLSYQAEMLRVSGQSEQGVALLSRFLSEVPPLLDERLQHRTANHPVAPIYKAAFSLLRRSKRHDQALSWAKLHFVTCDFEAGAIERSTAQLAQVWAEGEKLSDVQAFGAAQAEASRPNPLREVPLPALDEAQLREGLETSLRPLQSRNSSRWSQATHDAITILAVLGEKEDLGLAMSLARQLLAVDKAAGTREVCRVFKAADHSVARANGFVQFLEGKGEDPMPAFFQEYPEVPVKPLPVPGAGGRA